MPAQFCLGKALLNAAFVEFQPELSMIGVFLCQDLYMAFSAAILYAAAAVSAPHDNFNATLWYQTSAEFRANSLQTYKMASLTLKEALTDKNWTALPGQTSDFQQLPPAIIVDIDETILDNSQRLPRPFWSKTLVLTANVGITGSQLQKPKPYRARWIFSIWPAKTA